MSIRLIYADLEKKPRDYAEISVQLQAKMKSLLASVLLQKQDDAETHADTIHSLAVELYSSIRAMR